MQLRLFKTLWGHRGSWEDAAREAAEAGFDGLEAPVPADAAGQAALRTALAEHGLGLIAEVTTACAPAVYVPRREASADEHLADLRATIERSLPFNPRFFNVMAGCDAWPEAQCIDFYGRCLDIAAAHGVQLSFELHRGRPTFHPWATQRYAQALPALRFTCDFSHWCVVCERLLDTEPEVITTLARHAHHVHGRIGYDQGPQVPHPAAPEYAPALAAHQRWWEAIWTAQRAAGYRETTLTPEFGPDGYLHTLPWTQAPVADLWEINRWIGATERAHFDRWAAAGG